ncbi:hypothetical protein [Pseudonocardia sp. MH-G8]|uniref:hypothetical protein n=1 Tax=Pseudonocardia sp. MH-G8 TaxID=1854588 RepID=UPI000BA0D7B4|nr:hypothetical protein [Pseudonocardia sp. MH-G8]OZM77192.1 hypothetical protein CFP66_36810 [Pseudonocardia sp. MH-G8]
MRDRPEREVTIDGEDGRPLATARITVIDASTAWACLHVESGHVPCGTRSRLVDAVLDLPEVAACQHLRVALPIGDTEILERMRTRCNCTAARAAGSTCLVEAEILTQAER